MTAASRAASRLRRLSARVGGVVLRLRVRLCRRGVLELGLVGGGAMVVGMFVRVRCEAVLVFLREVVERESDGGDWLTEVVHLGGGSYRRPR